MEGWRDAGMEGWRDEGTEGWGDRGMEGWRDGCMNGPYLGPSPMLAPGLSQKHDDLRLWQIVMDWPETLALGRGALRFDDWLRKLFFEDLF